MKSRSPRLDGVQGAGEQRTNPYIEYGEGAAQPAKGSPSREDSAWGKAPQSAKNTSGTARYAGRQAGVARRSGGYTIVESMIFLGIAATLFLTALLMISGRQREVQFGQGVNEADARIRDVINDVGSGFFPDIGTYRCTADPVTADAQPSFAAGSGVNTTQGSRKDCTFIGKVLQFYQDSNQVKVFTIVGRRQTPTGTVPRLATSLYEAQPVAASGIANLIQSFELQWGVRVWKMFYIVGAGGPQTTDALGFFTSLGQYGSSGDPISGAQQVSLATINTTSLADTQATLISKIDCNTDTNCGDGVASPPILNNNNNLSVTLCLKSGNRKAQIVVGTANRQLTTDINTNVTSGECA